MTATFAGADRVGTAVTSERPPATITPITIDASPTRRTLAGQCELINWLLPSGLMRMKSRLQREKQHPRAAGLTPTPRARSSRSLPATDVKWCGREDSNLHGLPR